MLISNANIVITGAGSGFGRAMSVFFANIGSRVVAIDINREALHELKIEVPTIDTFYCDITNYREVETVLDNIFISNDEVNVLINNAGIMRNEPLINILKRPNGRHSVELWQKVIEINQCAVFYTTRVFIDNLIKRRNKGLIINISSIAAEGNAGQTAYSASKAAVEAMTKVWAKELGVFGVRSVAIAPGFIDTSGTHDAIEEKKLNKWIEQTPLKRTGKIEEIVSTVRFVIENDFVNGEVIHVNGGLSI